MILQSFGVIRIHSPHDNALDRQDPHPNALWHRCSAEVSTPLRWSETTQHQLAVRALQANRGHEVAEAGGRGCETAVAQKSQHPSDEQAATRALFGCRRSAGQSRARSREPGESAQWHRCSHVGLSVQIHRPSGLKADSGRPPRGQRRVRQLVRQPARFRGCSWVYADLRETLGPAETRHPRTPTDPLPESGGQVVAGSNPVSPTQVRSTLRSCTWGPFKDRTQMLYPIEFSHAVRQQTTRLCGLLAQLDGASLNLRFMTDIESLPSVRTLRRADGLAWETLLEPILRDTARLSRNSSRRSPKSVAWFPFCWTNSPVMGCPSSSSTAARSSAR